VETNYQVVMAYGYVGFTIGVAENADQGFFVQPTIPIAANMDHVPVPVVLWLHNANNRSVTVLLTFE